MFGKPNMSPKRNANFISPPPMASFFVRAEKITETVIKNKKAPIPQNKLMINDEGLMNN
jgi:hypothetical protein